MRCRIVKVNPDAKGTLIKAIKEVNSLKQRPDFIVFTGDLTQTTDDTNIRKARMKEFKQIVGELDAPVVRFMPGEHDASLDNGETYKDFFGETHYVFDHKGVHFIAIDNVSDPTGSIGDSQLEWLQKDLAGQNPRILTVCNCLGWKVRWVLKLPGLWSGSRVG